jgi:hypothetical protein
MFEDIPMYKTLKKACHAFPKVSYSDLESAKRAQQWSFYVSKSGLAAYTFYKGVYHVVAGIELENPSGAPMDVVENMVCKLNMPIKVLMDVKPIGIKRVIDELEFKAAKKENQAKRLNPKTPSGRIKSKTLEVQTKKLRELIETIERGRIPFKASFIILSSASSRNIYQAESEARSQIESAKAGFETVYKCRSRPLSGIEVLGVLWGGDNDSY